MENYTSVLLNRAGKIDVIIIENMPTVQHCQNMTNKRGIG